MLRASGEAGALECRFRSLGQEVDLRKLGFWIRDLGLRVSVEGLRPSRFGLLGIRVSGFCAEGLGFRV